MITISRKHQRISFEISRKVADYIDEHHGTCEVNLAPFAVFLDENEMNCGLISKIYKRCA